MGFTKTQAVETTVVVPREDVPELIEQTYGKNAQAKLAAIRRDLKPVSESAILDTDE